MLARAGDAEAIAPKRVKIIGPPSMSPRAIARNLQALAEYFDLLITLTQHRVRVRYKQSALGIGWALAQPVALMAIYTVIFSVVARMKSEGMPYAVFVYAALLPWTFFATSVGTAANGLVSHATLVTKVFFPREIIPLTYVLAGIFDLVVAALVLVALMLYYAIPITAYILWLIPVLAVEIAFITALALLLSAIQVRARDVGHAIPLLMQVWMFASPVVYPLAQVPARFHDWYILNPMVGIVENFRRVVIQGQAPDIPSLTTAAIASAVLLPIAYIYFKRSEATMADVI